MLHNHHARRSNLRTMLLLLRIFVISARSSEVQVLLQFGAPACKLTIKFRIILQNDRLCIILKNRKMYISIYSALIEV